MLFDLADEEVFDAVLQIADWVVLVVDVAAELLLHLDRLRGRLFGVFRAGQPAVSKSLRALELDFE